MSQKQDTPAAKASTKESKQPETKKEPQPAASVPAVPSPPLGDATNPPAPEGAVIPPPPPPPPQPIIRRFRRPIARPPPPPPKTAPEIPSAPKRPEATKGTDYLQAALVDKGELATKLKSIKGHQMFRDAVLRFWALLQGLPSNRVPRSEMRRLLHRLYKLLLPRYNESYVDQVISYTLAYYLGNAESLDFEMFTRIIFDVTHIWTPNVDLLEYVSFLQAVFKRVVAVFVHLLDGKGVEECKPRVTVRFPEEERRVGGQLKSETAEWLPCGTDEIEQDGWEYTFKPDVQDPNKYQKLKRQKAQPKKAVQRGAATVAEEEWNTGEPAGDSITQMRLEYRLAETEQVLPLGYVAELFLVELANRKEEKTDASMMLTEELIVKNGVAKGLANQPKTLPVAVKVDSRTQAKVSAFVELGDITEQVLQHAVREGKEHSLGVFIPVLAGVNCGELPQGIDLKMACSLGLRRRLVLEQLKMGKELELVNVNYTLERREVKRAIENKLTLRSDKDNLVLTDEETGPRGAGDKGRARFDDPNKESPYLNDIEYTKFIQLVLGQKQNLIKRELRAAKHEEAKKPAEAMRHDSGPKMDDPLYHLRSDREIRRDPFTSEHAVIDFAKKDVFYRICDNPRIVAGDTGHRQAKVREVNAGEGDRKGAGPGLC